jgi:hypothetical protein
MKLPVVKPPFEVEANATVYFEVPTGEVRIEKKTRNRIPVYGETSITAWIAEIGESARIEQQDGQNLIERRVRGYFLVDKLPTGIRGGDRVRVVMETSNGTEELRLFFNERATPLKGMVIASLGIPFEGFVQAIGGAF